MAITKPYPHQEECLQEIEDFNGRALVAMQMGLGKSLTSLLYLHRHPEIQTAVVVCPASIKWVWVKEARMHVGIRAEVLETHKVATAPLPVRSRLWIINYDILHSWLEFLRGLQPQLIIGDEIHYIQGRNTLRTRSFRTLCEGVPHVLALSGTPLVNRPAELWPTLNILRPKIWPNFHSFAHRHAGARLRHWGWDFRGASRIPELHQDLSQYCLVRRRKEDVLKGLPPKARHVLPLAITGRRTYDKAVKDFLGWLRSVSPSKARRAARAEQMVKLGYLLRLTARLKMQAVFEWVDNFLEDGNKLLLYAIHTKVLDALEKRYKRISVRVDGSVLGKQRQKAFDQFNRLARTRLLLGNIDAAGVGWSCASASDVAFAELPWQPGKVEQCVDRAHGLKRGIEGRRTRAWFLVAHGTCEEKLCEILQRKQKTVDHTLDGGKVKDTLDIHDLLIRTLERGSR